MALQTPIRPARSLRALLSGLSGVQLPGCFDPLSARFVEEAGFAATAISGFAVEVAHLAQPDIGLITPN